MMPQTGVYRCVQVWYLGLVVEGAPLIIILELLLLPRRFTHLQHEQHDSIRLRTHETVNI